MELLRSGEARFIVALAADMREKLGLFHDFDMFVSDLMPGLIRGQIAFQRVLAAYRLLNPAIHKMMLQKQIDFEGLGQS